jgi:hypothetical protein
LQTPGEVERQAKERLNLKLPGEQVVVVIAARASSTQEHAKQALGGWWRWLIGFFE